MFKSRSAIACAAAALAFILGGQYPAHASPSLSSVQAQITNLQVQAAAAAEAGQQAQVELGRLTR